MNHCHSQQSQSFSSSALLALQQAVPVLAGASLALVANRATGVPFSVPGLLILLCGIAAAYSFDRIIDAGDEFLPHWLKKAQLSVFVLSSLTLLGTVAFLPRAVAFTVLFFSAICLLYTKLKKLPLAKTVLVTLLWSWSCLSLPLQHSADLPAHWWSRVVAVPLTLLIASACILCDLKDIDEDRSNFIVTLAVLFGPRKTCQVAAALALFAAVLAAIDARYGLAIGSLLLLSIACFPSFLREHPNATLLVDSTLVLPGLLILFHLV
ncbi:UbiA family prenyltransferase [Candidatus Sumerlaeota bacterium]|nr:UbiA family prenyltransferase [Candidatus Sumerlaeota bacterium]